MVLLDKRELAHELRKLPYGQTHTHFFSVIGSLDVTRSRMLGRRVPSNCKFMGVNSPESNLIIISDTY